MMLNGSQDVKRRSTVLNKVWLLSNIRLRKMYPTLTLGDGVESGRMTET